MSEDPPPLKDPFALDGDERDRRARRTPAPLSAVPLPDPFARLPQAPATPAPPTTRAPRRPALSDEPLRRPLTVVSAATPAAVPAPAAPAVAETLHGVDLSGAGLDLTGRELTMPATPAAGSAPAPASPLLAGAEPTLLTGREATMPGMPAEPVPSAAPPTEATLLTGRELTMPATPAAPASSAGGDAQHGDTPRTMPRMAARMHPRATPTPGQRHGTSAAYDDLWHLQGRQGPFTGQEWGDWELGGILGEGGMGAVYRAKQKSLNRRVALKVLAPNLAADLKLLQRFQLEARTASLLASPNVVQVFAAGEWEGNHFFVMEYVEGRDLYDVMKQRVADDKPFTPDEAAGIVVQAAKGLAEAGRIGVVHRDIKPPNLMVTDDGLVKVADFGIVKVMGEAVLTMTGQAVGTPSYVSPEQGRGESSIDQRSDLYSLGVVFYELLTGQKPFEGSTPNAIIYQHCYGEPKLPRELNPAIDEKYQAVVLKCLQKKPENRYQDAGELIRDLEDIRSGRMLASALANYRQGTGADEAKRENMSWAQRHLLVLVSAVGLAVIGAGLGLWLLNQHSNAVNNEEQLQLERARELVRTLSLLDSPQPIPGGAAASLEEYARMPMADQRRVTLWRAKLKRELDLRQRLKALDVGEIPLALRRTAPGELLAYQELVGIADPMVVTWKERLDDLGKRERELRLRLREVDQQVDLTQTVVDSVAPQVRQLAVMSGDDDPLVKRVTSRLDEFAGRRDRYLANLAVLDRAGAVVTESQRARLQSELAELTRMVGKDERIDRWGVMLTSNAERIAQLRSRMRRLDQFELPPLALQLELDKDLAALKELVDDNDPELRGWKAKIAATAAEIESLRKRLVRLDQPSLLTIDEVEPMNRLLGALRDLVGAGDEDLARWQARHKASVARHGELRTALTRLDRPEPLTLAEQRLLASARELLADLGGLAQEQDAGYQRRLADERTLTAARLQRLQVLDGASPLTVELRQDLATYAAQAGEDDAAVQRWNAKRGRIDALRARAEPLDRAAPVPAGAHALLEALETEVGGGDDDLRRWRAKLHQVDSTIAALAPLDRAQPLPAGTASQLAELARLVGDGAPRYLAWRAKLERIATLKADLARLLATYGLAPEAHAGAHAAFDELLGLVSAQDEQLKAWAPRLALLDGPGQPAWASASGRDSFGLWADLALGPAAVQRFRFVPSGGFVMGSPEQEAGRDADEIQVPVVISSAFWLADTECTQAWWEAAMGNNPSRHLASDRPVERVSWRDVQLLTARLAQERGIALRLPTEAEWEYACRAGSPSPFASARSEVSAVEMIAWFHANAGAASKAVKLRFPNPIGLYDLHGNVWEWCQDRYGPYPTVAVADPLGRDGETFVARGGSWGDPAAQVRAANRASLKGELRSAYVGLRLVSDVAWPGGTPPDGQRLLAGEGASATGVPAATPAAPGVPAVPAPHPEPQAPAPLAAPAGGTPPPAGVSEAGSPSAPATTAAAEDVRSPSSADAGLAATEPMPAVGEPAATTIPPSEPAP
jgi:formylglycine-generating enzyme required for sulfatase activity